MEKPSDRDQLDSILRMLIEHNFESWNEVQEAESLKVQKAQEELRAKEDQRVLEAQKALEEQSRDENPEEQKIDDLEMKDLEEEKEQHHQHEEHRQESTRASQSQRIYSQESSSLYRTIGQAYEDGEWDDEESQIRT